MMFLLQQPVWKRAHTAATGKRMPLLHCETTFSARELPSKIITAEARRHSRRRRVVIRLLYAKRLKKQDAKPYSRGQQ